MIRSLLVPLFLLVMVASIASAASIDRIGPENRFPMAGKEVDWIDGDYVIRSDELVAVIAKPGSRRHANMTVRGVGACLIDLTRTDIESDQLSCYYPAAGRFRFFDDELVETGELEGGGVFWRCRSSEPTADNATQATIEYQLRDGEPYVTVIVDVTGDNLSKVVPLDGVRADVSFRFGVIDETSIGYCEDEVFRQTYGFESVGGEKVPTWSRDRMRELRHDPSALEETDAGVRWVTRVFPASSALDLWGLSNGAAAQTIQVSGAKGDQPRIKLSLIEGETGTVARPAVWRSAPDGKSIVHLPKGQYRILAEAIGHEPTETAIEVSGQPGTHNIELGRATLVSARVVDSKGNPVPCKVTFYGARTADGQTDDPKFGVESQSGSVGNCVYSADGTFVRSIPPGAYDILISRGPEYDAVFERVEIQPGETRIVTATLKRVVDTTGWVSAELHSHSSPSGDNTSDQLGRVENLVCEQIDFAPCTEHQRIESYDDQLKTLGAERFMATCSGMELTGSPLPINHQNAFPLKWDPFGQDGGGPSTSSDPVAQIARLAMWDDNSKKVVQTNHPNLRQLIRDKDLDGTDDGGFAKMLDYMDVMEVHPPEDIFLTEEQTAAKKKPDENRIRPWMELLKTGRRIPGVVNTDAHYNWNGSGWLRNWVRCSTDDPTQIETEEMIDRLEGGQIIMSTGPFMTVQLHHPSLDKPANIGDTIKIDDGPAELAVRIQCANWLDINRVEVFVNGELQPDLSRTRKEQPDAFADGVVKFDQRLELTIPENAFVIVAAIGERLDLGRVMGKRYGRRPPVVVSNPIYVETSN